MIGVLAALITSLLWALTAMLVKVESARLSVVAINFYRVLVAAIAFVGVFLVTRDPAELLRVPLPTVATLAIAVSEPTETVEDVYEPFLIQQGLLMRTPRGRVATAAAYRHLGMVVPTATADGSALPGLFD